MYRSFRLRYYNQRQRRLALGLALGASATLGSLGALHKTRPLRADGGSTDRTDLWKTKSTVVVPESRSTHRSDKSFQADHAGARHDRSPPPAQTQPSSEDRASETKIPAWEDVTGRIASISESFVGFELEGIRSKIVNVILPAWVRMLPGYMDKLQDELSGAPWSLSWEIWEDAHDPEKNEEIIWEATVRISKDLCPEELAYQVKRREHTRRALAKYLGVPESEVHADDVPIIGMCGSGGGLRALVAGASSALCVQESGLLDCVTYTAGVSGSCWLETLFNSSIGKQDFARVLEHLKHRIGVHIAYPPSALALLSQAPTNKFLLSGFVEKLRGVPDADFNLVDVYGLLLAGRLLVPKDELRIDSNDLKISQQRRFVDGGTSPMPIYTAVRHEIPEDGDRRENPSSRAWRDVKHSDWFQWYEWSPYEFACEELECGIPTWAVGRRWHAGENVWRENGLSLPELRIPLMMGIWGSAFCATLSHYYKEVRPLLKAAGLSGLDDLVTGKDSKLVKVHPIDPAMIPNFALGLRDKLPTSCPETVHSASHLQLMDAGMSNNLPIYPLLRTGRDVDIVIAFDASADVRGDNWVRVVEEYARQRGIKGWPMGAGWPRQTQQHETTVAELDQAQSGHAPPSAAPAPDLGYCSVWCGSITADTTHPDPPAAARLADSDSDAERLLHPDAGIALIYFPFLANPAVPGVDPLSADFMSTWNFVYTPEQIESVVALARANYNEGGEQTRRTIRAVWERKRRARLGREQVEREAGWRRRIRTGGAAARRNGDVGQGDQFGGGV